MPINSYLLIGALLITTIIILPFTFPSHVQVKRQATLNANAQKIFSLISSNKGFQSFNPYKDTDPNLSISLFGPQYGVGSAFTFEGKEGKGSQTITAISENRSVTMLIDLGDMGKPIQNITLNETDKGTQVLWTIDTKLGINPIARTFGLFMESMMGSTIERGLKNLDTATKAIS